MKLFSNYISLVFIFLFVNSCSKNENATHSGPPTPMGKVNIDFANYVDTLPLVLGTQQYLNANGDTFTVTTWHYYISNIKLISIGNDTVSEVESYHILKANDISTLSFTVKNVPVDEYNSIQFTIGVDSLRNVSGAQTGALDPVHNMFWSWSNGYLFTKFEAFSPQSPSGGVNYHVGGFTGPFKALKTVSLNFPSNATVTKTLIPQVNIKTDLGEYFKNPSTLKFGVNYDVTAVSAISAALANNYADMFSIIAVVN